MATRTRDDQTGLDELEPAAHPARDSVHFRRIIKAREALAAAEQELHDAVRAARDAGDSWTIIGAALDTSRQAAQQRFGDEVSSPGRVRRSRGREG
jgi:dihydroxyacetone kinase